MTGWLLQEIEIEGFRGINNEKTPLVLKFKTDKVNSISAPNGVGKSSIFQALQYALTGRVSKLEDLPAVEAGGSYYLNKFHSGGVGTIKLTLVPELGGNARTIIVTRTANGLRTSSCSDGTDAEAALAELNREFVLLDAETFQNFISLAPLDRGRSFAGLLGLAPYSTLRQGLQSISNTRAFNNHFGDAGRKTALSGAGRRVAQYTQTVSADYVALVKEPITEVASMTAAYERAHGSLAQIALLADHCKGKPFKDIDVDACTTAIKDAEAGPNRQKLAQIIQQEGTWNSLVSDQPDLQAVDRLKQFARNRDLSLASTKGDLLRQLYELGVKITGDDAWDNKNLCPACDVEGGTSILVTLREKLDLYASVEAAAEPISTAWAEGGWPALVS